MFITRAASRSTPRLALRANYNTLSGLRHRLQPALRPIACTTQSVTSYQKAGFRTSLTKLDVTSQHLSTKLEKEIEFEKDSSDRRTDSDENVRTFCKQNSFWEIEDKSGEPEIVLRRKYEDESIVVVFSIADLETPSPYIDDEVDDALTDNDGEPETMGSQSGGANSKGAINQGGKPDGNFAVAPQDSAAPGDREGLSDEEDNYDAREQTFATAVDVLISRSGDRGSLHINLLADDGHFTIERVTHLPPSSADALEQLRNPPKSIYAGPMFDPLDEELKSIFDDYLEARGIDTALAALVPDYTDVKEQKEYVDWLQRVKNFVD